MLRRKLGFGLLALAPWPMLLAQSSAPPTPTPRVDYDSEILPIFRAQCFSCHGPDNAQGGLRLDTPEGLEKGGASGPAISPGDASKSLLVARILGQGGKPRMPMGFAPLTPRQIARIRAWIGQGASTRKISFADDVLPIFRAHCSSCHSGAAPKAGLNLMSGAGIARGGPSGKLTVPGEPNRSLLVRRLMGLDGKQRMPMGFIPLNDSQMSAIRAWIEHGASTASDARQVHWSYLAPKAPAIPKTQRARWVRNPIDAFVLAKLESEGLSPSPEADRPTLLRRLSLDLIGLPPSPEEVDAYLLDKSPGAYERVVERLLASPHYGERQARPWLDLARYADSNGYEADFTRLAWKYRDWVIAALNENMPFDRFTVEQIAGDLLPNATLPQLVATGFHRNTMFNSEGGVDADEAMFETILDRVGATATVWLGSTLACARCHDHKYDPFSQRDFYRMYAFFSNNEFETKGEFNLGSRKHYEPEIPAPSAAQAAEVASHEVKTVVLEREFAKNTPQLDSERRAWEAALRASRGWSAIHPRSAAPAPHVAAQAVGEILVGSGIGPQAAISVRFKADAATLLRIEARPDASLPANGPGRASSGNFILSRVELTDGDRKIRISDARADFVQAGYQLAGLFDEEGDTGWAIYPQQGKPHWLLLTLAEPLTSPDAELVLRFESKSWPNHVFGRFRVRATSEPPELASVPDDIRTLVRLEVRSQSEQAEIERYFRTVAACLGPIRDELALTKSNLEALRSRVPLAFVLRERRVDGPLKANLHIRGEFLSLGDVVEAGVPAFLPGLPPGVRADRLSLARWIASPNHPLTARVKVNRLFEQYFGLGLVETLEDFGTQGSPPTHRALLDWLATEFVRRRWDVKSMHRLIVTSATYRQGSNATPKLLALDPENRLLARGPRFRLEAESIRDVALAASGLLNPAVGGPSVFPYQPDGIWDSPYSGEQWTPSKDKDRFRRGLYTFWKRTAPYPNFMAFDATTRESCTARRLRTNTPVQALALLNDRAFLETAQGLAARMAAARKEPAARIRYGFRLCTARYPSKKEADTLLAAFDSIRSRYASSQATAEKLGGIDLAAWTMVGSILLNLDETITKS